MDYVSLIVIVAIVVGTWRILWLFQVEYGAGKIPISRDSGNINEDDDDYVLNDYDSDYYFDDHADDY